MASAPVPPNWRPRTLAVRGGIRRTPEREHCEPLYLTSSFVYENAEQAADYFAERKLGNVYSRFTNPSVELFNTRLAALEGGEASVSLASGMAATTALFLSFLRNGEHLVASRGLFGSTLSLIRNYLPRWGIEATLVDGRDLEAWRQAIRGNTKLLFVETPSNPMMEIADMGALAGIAHSAGIRLAVDNCFCSPALQRPLDFGADLVVHSATKYIDGQGRCLGGAVVGSRQDTREVFQLLRTTGPCLSPANAWILSKGLETLDLRMREHSEGAMKLASFLRDHKAVKAVLYPGLEDHPQHELATQQQSGFGGLLSICLGGGRERAWQLIDALRLYSITANFGDCKSTVTHPATTTHGRISEMDRTAMGITEDLVRISVGLEQIEDLIEDISRALDSLKR